MKKLNLYGQIASVLSALAILAGCSGQENTDDGFAEYVEAYTGGLVTGSSDIVVELTSPAVGISGSDSDIRKAVAGLFRFSPQLKGQARMESPERLVFTPEAGSMKPGRKYHCEFALGQVAMTDKDHQTFEFQFIAAEKEAAIEAGSVSVSRQDSDMASVSGTLIFSERIDIDNPAGLLAFDYDGSGNIEAETDPAGERINFTVSGLRRPGAGEKDRLLRIRFVPGNTGFKECAPAETMIPAIGNFRAMCAVPGNGENSYVDIVFSEPLDPRQNLRGLAGTDINEDGANMKIEDNRLRIFGDGKSRISSVRIEPGIMSPSGERIEEAWSSSVSGYTRKPEVWIPRDGNILPDGDNIVFPFCAVNLNAVDISVMKIYPDNILTFLQDNDMEGSYCLRRAGRLVYRTTLSLEGRGQDLKKPGNYNIDLSGLFKKDPGAMYRVRLSFRQDYYIYHPESRSSVKGLVRADKGIPDMEENAVWDIAEPYYYDNSYDWSLYNWQDRENPMTPSYYMAYDYPSRNLMFSELGVIAKYSGVSDEGKTSLWTAVSNIISAEPVSGAEITAYNYQLQKVGSGRSSSDGLAEIKCTGRPFAVKVKKGESTTYLKVNDGTEKSLSRFDTGGEILEKGLKGFIYGDRGVWRPGDTLHLALMVHGGIPEGHPATMSLYSPEGQFFAKRIATGGNGLFVFDIATTQDSPTGIWSATFKVGGASFHKSLHIETIKPNRLKINTTINEQILKAGQAVNISTEAQWLTGPAAAGLGARAEMTLRKIANPFSGFGDYAFSLPSGTFAPVTSELYRTTLGQDGTATLSVKLPEAEGAPGLLEADIASYVAEEGGDESISVQTRLFSPYGGYVGVKLPSDYLETGRDNVIDVAVLDAEGRRKSGDRIEWRIFKLKWSWWWESGREPLDSYTNGSGATAVSSGTMISGNGDLKIPFRADDSQWGRYLIYVKDLDSGHCSGGIFYADWPAYRGRADRKDPDAPAMLAFSLDRKVCRAGDEVTVFIPASENGRALVSIENGRGVLRSEWVRTQPSEDTPWKFRVTEEMSPNIYVHITLVQPYGNATNDLPIRMYGVTPLTVENPDSHLEPVIVMPDRLHPEEAFTVKVSEKKGRPMTYTLAIVDEGLLDLTAFRTPDPWSAMYRREALGVRTWDMYDNVFQSFGGIMKGMFSIGGDEGFMKGARKENRFNPVVRFLGPFTLKSGSASHRIKLPMYVGSVRVMVVACNGRAYGNADKTVPVTSPLMILPTLPRKAGCGEKITLPVNVMVMEGNIEEVKVTASCRGSLKISGDGTRTISMAGRKDGMVRFDMVSGDVSGMSQVTVTAEGGGHRMTETIYIEVSNSSPQVITSSSAVLQPGESKVFSFKPFKENREDRVWAEACGHPSIDWNAMFGFFRNYPHSCSEQVCAAGISILYSLKELSDENRETAGKMIPELLGTLYSRQRADGGIACWPGASASDEWVSSMALEFLVTAGNEGFSIGNDVLRNLVNYQKRCSQNFKTSKPYEFDDLAQAYRLFSLGLSGNPDEAAMNRLKMSGKLSWQGSMMLASAYCICGRKSVGEEIIASLSTSSDVGRIGGRTYRSPFRDKAIALEALSLCGNVAEAVRYAAEVCSEDGIWALSTQESAFAAKAFNALGKKVTGGKIDVTATNSKESSEQNGLIFNLIDPESGETCMTNNSSGPVYARVTSAARIPAGTPVPSRSENLGIDVRYSGSDGEALSPESLRQGTVFTAVIKVSNLSPVSGADNLALTYRIPSGWEIVDRRTEIAGGTVQYDRLDIRDDRSIFYFSLPQGRSMEFRVRLRAAYEGEFVLPSTSCEDMYDTNVYACTASGKCSVTR